MRLEFTKMQAAGNDFILIDDREQRIADEKKGRIARFLCTRRFSVGADGVLFLCKPTSTSTPTRSYDLRMRVFNADGSEAEMCGNGIRCFARYAYEKGLVRNRRIRVETLAGLIVPEVEDPDEEGFGVGVGEVSIRVFMGKPVFERIDEPFFVNEQIGEVRLTALSLGNPHAVILVDSFDELDVDTVGKSIESHPAFPDRTNVDFVMMLREDNKANEMSVRTYERGVGETLSCGTGSTASVLALNKLGYINASEPVTVHTRGGDLMVELKEEEGAYLIGSAEVVYDGEVEVEVNE
uniref:Diaminopimelate epimerase n=1 Tax=Candidatus Methanophagaceae archaeon ANME-1 ERB6 TaxID=2759912 RepID=A0A7G9YU07_9EURY|nr:diaminopimelate epimerase [Methanosarcinales archaeon ANME-1 ERB6]